MDIKVSRFNLDLISDWNEVLLSSKNGHFLYSREYISYHGEKFEDISPIVYLNDKPVAFMPAAIDRTNGHIQSHPGLTFGGVVLLKELRGDIAIQIIDSCFKSLADWGGVSLTIKILPSIYCSYPAEELQYFLWSRGFSLIKRHLSSVLSMKNPLPLNSSKKQAIAKANKLGFKVETGSLEGFYNLLSSVLEERHCSKPVHTLDELKILTSRFSSHILLRTIVHEGEMIAGAIIYVYPNALHTQYLASSEKGRKTGALDKIIESIICLAAETDMDYVSFGTSTASSNTEVNYGLLWQKESFGARSIVYDIMNGKI